jgi:hypothetical protein
MPDDKYDVPVPVGVLGGRIYTVAPVAEETKAV